MDSHVQLMAGASEDAEGAFESKLFRVIRIGPSVNDDQAAVLLDGKHANPVMTMPPHGLFDDVFQPRVSHDCLSQD